MKYLSLTALMFVSCFAFANKIDSLKTNQDVEKFIQKQYKLTYPDGYGKDYYEFTIEKPDSVWQDIDCDSVIQSWKFKRWQKIDFNKDGNTDLFAIFYIRNKKEKIGRCVICTFIDEDNDHFRLRQITGSSFFDCSAAIPAYIDSEPFMLYRHYAIEYSSTYDTLNGVAFEKKMACYVPKTTILVYKYGGFIELNKSTPSMKKIKSVAFSTSPCFIDCPSFDLKTDRNGNATYHLNEGIETNGGEFAGTINKPDIDGLIALLDYINIDYQDSSYELPATDLQFSTLEVRFSDGSKKIIKDYGMQGTLGLERVYEILDGFRKNQQWKATKFHKVKKEKADLSNLLHRN